MTTINQLLWNNDELTVIDAGQRYMERKHPERAVDDYSLELFTAPDDLHILYIWLEDDPKPLRMWTNYYLDLLAQNIDRSH